MSENPSMRAAESSANPTLASRQAWGLVFAVLLLYLLLRWVAGPLPQWLDYHDFADTRVLGFVPRAGLVGRVTMKFFDGRRGAPVWAPVN